MGTDLIPCGCDEERRERLVDSSSERASRVKELIKREQALLRCILVLIILMNFYYGRYALYPFMLFSTWVHEMCTLFHHRGHAIAALLVGGGVSKILIYSNGGGLTYSSIPADNWYTTRYVIVASAGYVGTAIVGGIMLLFRRTRRGPRIGLIGLGTIMVLSCAFWIRNSFGLEFFLPVGVGLILCGWLMNGCLVREFYAFLAATCCLNAVVRVKALFDYDDWSGDNAQDTDAHIVAELLFDPYWFWALLWFCISIIMCIFGLLFGLNPSDDPSRGDNLYPATTGVDYA